MKSKETELFYYYLLLDLFLLNIALTIAVSINKTFSFDNFEAVYNYFIQGNMAWIISYLAFSKRNLFLRDRFLNRILRITRRHIVFIIVAATISVVLIPRELSRRFFAEYSFIFYSEKIIFYWLFYEYLKRRRGSNSSIKAAVIGCNDTGYILKRVMENNLSLGYIFSGFICSNNYSDKNFIGRTEELEQLIDKHNLHIIFYTISFFNGDNAERKGKEVLKICNKKGVRVRFVPTNQHWFRNRINTETVGNIVILDPQEIPLDNARFRLQKRTFDILFSAIVILFIFPWLFPILIILQQLDSRGTVFFIQDRTGINNKTFKCIKFRSMKINKEADEKQATWNDERITKFGRFLRKTSIDELPQFLNVFVGNMSVVGPRPHMLKHTKQYSQLIEFYLTRHYIKPGITGLAQVKGYRGETKDVKAMENRVEADMEYIDNWNMTMDLKIIWQTIFGLSSHDNAN